MKDWHQLFINYEEFLKKIPIEKYQELRDIKTVEQDLPKNINPMPLLYKFYWKDNEEDNKFVDFDSFFNEYWEKNHADIMKFKEKFFCGCTEEFVKKGFKARLYRTWISFLTQLHFMYLWNTLFEEKIKADAKLDISGVDGSVEVKTKKYDIGIRKISQRREAREKRMRKREANIYFFEIPYSVDNPEELKNKRSRKKEIKEYYQKLSQFIERYLDRFPNGFVVFKKEYAYKVYELMEKHNEDFTAERVIEVLLKET